MQVHYNLLVGDKPVKNSLVLHTVPASTPLLPLNLDLMPAPPDIPCPAGVTGPLCSRTASLANLGTAVRSERRPFRERSRVGMRAKPVRPSGGRLDVVRVADLQQWLHRSGGCAHASSRGHFQDGPQPRNA